MPPSGSQPGVSTLMIAYPKRWWFLCLFLDPAEWAKPLEAVG